MRGNMRTYHIQRALQVIQHTWEIPAMALDPSNLVLDLVPDHGCWSFAVRAPGLTVILPSHKLGIQALKLLFRCLIDLRYFVHTSYIFTDQLDGFVPLKRLITASLLNSMSPMARHTRAKHSRGFE